MRKQKEHLQKRYEVINIHPQYASEKDKNDAIQEMLRQYYFLCKRHGFVTIDSKSTV